MDGLEARGLGPARDRPRALLITSRFSTVMQYSTRDLAEALSRHGWNARVLIEPHDHGRFGRRAIAEELLRFEPHTVVQIDHLRREHGDLFPPQLPFVCWIQDDLPNLTNTKAGASVGPRDFVLTCAIAPYCETHGYPWRQCLHVPKLTRVPARPHRWDSDGLDLAYVSNASQTVEQATAEILAGMTASAELARLARTCCERIADVYARGETIHSPAQARAMLDEEAARVGGRWGDPALPQQITTRLFACLNNALYRQQALRWAVNIAKRRGLSLSIFGHGWERHPEFAPFAKGPVAYGEALEDLTRRTKINLQIVPYSCVHQRLLDGLVAGGFFLVRHHPFDDIGPAMDALLSEHLHPDARDEAAARAALHTEELRARFDAILEAYRRHTDTGGVDMVDAYRRFAADGNRYLLVGLPRLGAVSFDGEAALERLIERYLAPGAAEERDGVACAQREWVEAHLTYDAGARRIVAWMARLLAEERDESAAEAGRQPASKNAARREFSLPRRLAS